MYLIRSIIMAAIYAIFYRIFGSHIVAFAATFIAWRLVYIIPKHLVRIDRK